MKTWEIEYKGHDIKVENGLIRGENLIVDGEIQDGPLGIVGRSQMAGIIKEGEGKGELIKVYLGGYFTIGCRIFIDNSLVYCSRGGT